MSRFVPLCRLTQLEAKRAELLQSGKIKTASGTGADDAMVAWILGTTIEEARHLKWLVFVLAFDVLSLLFRLTGDMVSVNQTDSRLIANRLVVLLDSGLSVQEAGSLLANNSPPALPDNSDAIGSQSLPESKSQKTQATGFVNTNNRPASENSDTVLSTWNAELSKSGIDSPADPAMNQHADSDEIDRIVKRGQSSVYTRTEDDYTEHQQRYKLATGASVKSEIDCPWCAVKFTKKTYNHRFCCPAHKDEYWNAVKPERQVHKRKAA